MAEYPRAELNRLLGLIRQQTRNKFDGLISTAESTTWKPKPGWFPFEKACTTIGDTVYLSKYYLNQYNDWARCSLILHEATHVQQWRALGRLKFSAMYLIPSQRLKLEQAGVRNEFFWAIATHRLQDPDKQTDTMGYIRSNNLIQGSLRGLMEDYMMSVDHEELNRWALAVLREGFRLGFGG